MTLGDHIGIFLPNKKIKQSLIVFYNEAYPIPDVPTVLAKFQDIPMPGVVECQSPHSNYLSAHPEGLAAKVPEQLPIASP